VFSYYRMCSLTTECVLFTTGDSLGAYALFLEEKCKDYDAADEMYLRFFFFFLFFFFFSSEKCKDYDAADEMYLRFSFFSVFFSFLLLKIARTTRSADEMYLRFFFLFCWVSFFFSCMLSIIFFHPWCFVFILFNKCQKKQKKNSNRVGTRKC